MKKLYFKILVCVLTVSFTSCSIEEEDDSLNIIDNNFEEEAISKPIDLVIGGKGGFVPVGDDKIPLLEEN